MSRELELRHAFARVQVAEDAHRDALALLNSLEPRAPFRARAAVAAAWREVLAARKEEAKTFGLASV